MNIIKKILDTSSPSSPTDLNDLATINSAQLFLKRSPSSPKGELECICNDCVASIRKTTIPFNYQLIIQKAYQEDELDNDDDSEEDDDSSFDNALKDEWDFLIDESLSFKKDKNDNGISISWRELSGDFGDRFQLMIDPKQVKNSTIDLFINTIFRCEYERKYNVESSEISDKQLIAEFGKDAHDEDYLYKQFDKSLNLKEESSDDSSDEDFHDATDGSNEEIPDIKGDVFYKEKASFYLFDPKELKFKTQDKKAVVSIIQHGKFNYSLLVNTKPLCFLPISTAMNPVFDFDTLSFIFNSIRLGKSYLLRFENLEQLSSFQESFKIALWEILNKVEWLKVKGDEKDYILNDDDDLVLEEEDDVDSESESESESEPEQMVNKNLRVGNLKDDDDEDKDETEIAKKKFISSSKAVNGELAVGSKNTNTYLQRNDTLGVFEDDGDEVKFRVAIENIRAPNSKKTFKPSKMMLHSEDTSMILQNPDAKDHLYRMDLTKGKIVDDYYLKDGLNIVDFNPVTKLSQLTGEQTFAGLSSQSVFKIDPKLHGSKIVDNESKSYTTKTDFSAIATTAEGWSAVASNKGEMKLMDKFGLRAKTALPALEEPIISVDVTKDGRWILATCKTHLLLVDTEIKVGKNTGKSGFQVSFGADTKPRPKRITLSPEHIGHMVLEKTPLSFSPAHFDVDVDGKEQTIVTSTGPFVISWSLKKILRNDKSYTIKRYPSNVIAGNFKFGSDKKIYVEEEDDFGIVDKKSLKKATRESLGFNGVVETYY